MSDTDQANKEKPLGLHFSSTKHERRDIVNILEFIKKVLRSSQALIIRTRVEKRFIHLL